MIMSFNANFITVLIAIVATGFLIIVLRLKQNSNAVKKSGQIENEINSLGKEILVVTGDTVPGKKILQVLGAVRAVSDTQASSNQEFDLAEKEAMKKLMMSAMSMRANAVIGLKHSTGTYQQQNSNWKVSQVVYVGTAVRIK